MKNVVEITLNYELQRQFNRLKPGMVLDVGAGRTGYKDKVPHTRYLRLDNNKRYNPDIHCDAHNLKCEDNFANTVIMTEVLEHLSEPQKAIDEVYRVLKPNGICILSTRFIHPYHPHPKDYYRFTKDSLHRLFRDFRKVEVSYHGNAIQVVWFMITGNKVGKILQIFDFLVAKVRLKKTKFPFGLIVYAKKGCNHAH